MPPTPVAERDQTSIPAASTVLKIFSGFISPPLHEFPVLLLLWSTPIRPNAKPQCSKRCGRALPVKVSNAFLLLFLLAGEADLWRELASHSRRATGHKRACPTKTAGSRLWMGGFPANHAPGQCRSAVLVVGRTHRNRSDYYLHRQVAGVPMTSSMGGSEEMVSCTNGSGLVRLRSCHCS